MEITTNPQKSNYSSWKNALLVLLFVVIGPLTLVFSFYSLLSVDRLETQVAGASTDNLYRAPQSGVQVFAALPDNYPSISGEIEVGDARVEIIRQYLEAYKSPMEPFANYLVEAADKYSLDWRLTTAIAMKESGLCRVIPEGSHNCWGWGIHSEGTLGFDNYENAIDTVSRGLRTEYLDKGYETVDEIMKKYAHKDSTTWADGVKHYMEQISY